MAIYFERYLLNQIEKFSKKPHNSRVSKVKLKATVALTYSYDPEIEEEEVEEDFSF